MTLVLGIETSCDETAAAVIADGRAIRSNVVASQVDLHQKYGGVFPEMASRQHVVTITPVIEQAMGDAQTTWDDLSAIAVTHGPGLAGSLLVGVNVAKGLAYARGLPLVGVNHLEAHIATNWLDVSVAGGRAVPLPAMSRRSPMPVGEQAMLFDETGSSAPPAQGEPDPYQLTFPVLCLVVSGGHTELVLMHDYGEYQRLGATTDDAVGEAFDKVARLLGLEYPGGPAIQRVAQQGNPQAFPFPRARLDRSYDFSFSGLKTAVLRAVQKYEPELKRPADRVPGAATPSSRPRLHPRTAADLAASFQTAVVEALVEKTSRAAVEYKVSEVLLAGGVAANQALRERMQKALDVPLRLPPVALATDNATGVGVAGYWALRRGQVAGWDLDVVPNLTLT
jgi:tRNA N6-adenosine threonylcarbamoyltransferase